MSDKICLLTKPELRKQYREIRNRISEAVRNSESKRVCECILESRWYRDTDAVFCYLSYSTELETDHFICKALADGKIVAVPVIKENEMVFCRIYPDTEYRMNGYGISEPIKEDYVEPETFSLVLMILPGLCYDKYGGRIGYGGGYYDRYLAKHKDNAIFQTVSLALSCQYYDGRLPMEEHDIRPDAIIYPSSVWCES